MRDSGDDEKDLDDNIKASFAGVATRQSKNARLEFNYDDHQKSALLARKEEVAACASHP